MAAMAMRQLSSSEIERASLLGGMLLCGLLLLTCLWLAVKLVWLSLPGSSSTELAPLPASVSAEAGKAHAAVSVSKWHLFGNPGLTTAQLARSAPATQLQLQLRGTLAEADPRAGLAVISDPVSGERAYRVGDGLPGGATLDGVYPDRVVLLHEGVQETLGLPYDQPSGGGSASATAATAPAAGVNVLNPGAQHAASSAPSPQQIPAPVFVPPQMAQGAVDFSKIQHQLGVADPADLMRQVSAMPVMENGRMTGVRLSGGPNAALIGQLGLQPSDVVTSINNVPLDSMARATQVVDTLKNANRVTVTVMRDGKPVTLNVNVK